MQTNIWQALKAHGQMWFTSSDRATFANMRKQRGGASAQHYQVPLEQNAKEKIAHLRFVCGIAAEVSPDKHYLGGVAHSRYRTMEDREGRTWTWTWLVVCASLEAAFHSKTVTTVRNISSTQRFRVSETDGYLWFYLTIQKLN